MHRAWSIGVALILLARTGLAQPPTGVMPPLPPSAPAPAAPAPAAAAPPAPEASAPAAVPDTAPPAAPAPAAAAPAAVPSTVVPPGMALIPIEALNRLQAPPAPAPSAEEPGADSAETPSHEPSRAVHIYTGLAVGDGQPFGPQLVDPNGGSAKGGIGYLAFFGYAFHPNLGLDVFVHYNAASLTYGNEIQPQPSSSGHVVTYGLEARGMATAGPVMGWLSFGIATGSMSATVSGGDNQSGQTVSYSYEEKAELKLVPVLATGIEYLISPHFGIGPQARWYFTAYDKPCENGSATVTYNGGPGFPSQSFTDTIDRCAATTENTRTPDIVYIALGATYYMR